MTFVKNIKPKNCILIGIAGGSASGKTSVARKVLEGVGDENATIIEQDSYYKDLSHIPEDAMNHHNFDHPDAFDRDLLIEHMNTLLNGGVVKIPIYDFTRHCRTGLFRTVGPHHIIIIEGILILYNPHFRELMDIKVYVDAPDDIRLIRRLKRDIQERGRTMEMVLEQYRTTVMPMHLQFVEPSKRYADIIIPRGVSNVVAIDLLKTKIQQLIQTKNQKKAENS